MKHIIALAAVVLGAGCATSGYDGGDLTPGVSTMAEVEKDMGVPKDKRAGPDGQTILWYPRLPDGRVSYAARIGKDGKLIAIEQRLTRENLESIKPGASENDVRDLLGPPQSIQWFERQEVNAWSYNAQGIVQQIYVVEFSKDGTVRRAYRYDDPQFIPRR
jgi:hypothetical protein